ncbi:hypothetical protein ACFFQW_00315 [Umezawaea endophytica]|uniref:Uncharacterized protein n=1 Tax=Umezawaea endophytica TaxID=1654476 RepID=A0A9X2VHF6_9PSEU|nr:hypothetical protein [Umezawaea endophytica]MCS7476691.1 hypothetical protein [Umezawaea endophytica]
MRLPERFRPPRRPIRTALRFLVRAGWTWIAVSLDLNTPEPRESRPRPAKEITRDARR